MKRTLTMLGVSLTCAVPASMAHAYSDPERFAEEAAFGGGGGRYFTGSPVDGYSCKVCHSGGALPHVVVRGLPIDGFTPGTTYDVEISWSDPALSHALTLELVNRLGQPAGKLELPAEDQIDAKGRCELNPQGEPASYLADTGNRRVIGVKDCGAESVRFRFTAPNDTDVAFAAGVVQSDRSGTVQGDGVAELARIMYRQGTSPSTSGGSCALSPKQTSGSLATAWLALCALFARRRKRP